MTRAQAAVEVLDSRRLTGPNLYARSAGAVLELRLRPGAEPDAVIERWRAGLALARARLDWVGQEHARSFEGLDGRRGVELMFEAPVDQLYTATEVNEWAVAGAADPDRALGAALERFVEQAATEQGVRRGVVELIAAAETRGLPWLLDDDELSIGYFGGLARWPLAALPEPAAVDWSTLRGGPVALITGTNGKTTTTRMLARIAHGAGVRVGNTSTDGLYVDEALVEAGDWTGPGGARAVLRDASVELALLEAARGGLLRRGAGVRSCAVALITNVAEDHLGEYGIVDLAGMAAAKGVVATIVEATGRIVLGADSPALIAWARGRELPAPIVWCSTDPDDAVFAGPRSAGEELWTVIDEQICREQAGARVGLCAVAELPASFGGAARHNVQNALTAAAAARGLGFDDAAIAAGLRSFGAGPRDNPGRARLWSVVRPGSEAGPGSEGSRTELLLDFAHNLAGLRALASLVRGLGRRPTLCFGMAGDRSDEQLLELGAALAQFEPRRVILRELPAYLRGRELGEVPRLLERGLRRAGFEGGAIEHAPDEITSLDLGLRPREGEAPGDDELLVLLAHTERDAVDAWLEEHQARLAQFAPGTV